MKQINLKANNVARNSSPSSSLSLFLGVAILFISVAAYAFVHYQLSSVKNEIENTENLISRKKSQMNNKKYTELYLFEDKLLDLKNKMSVRSSQLTNLDSIAQKTLPETVFSSIGCKIDESGTSTYAAKLAVNDMDMLARQAKSYQTGENFANVNPLSSSLDEQGKIAADFTFEVVNKQEAPQDNTSTTAPAGQVPNVVE